MKKIVSLATLTLLPFVALLGGCGPGDENPPYAGTVTTFAGMGSASSVDGVGVLAGFNAPIGITTDGLNLFVADSGNHTIRRILIASGFVETLGGNAASAATATNGSGTVSRFNTPSGITRNGNKLYVADTSNNTIRQIDTSAGISAASAVVTSFAGTSTPGSSNGTSAAAGFNGPFGIVWNVTKLNLYVTDKGNHAIRQITTLAEVTTRAGNAASAAGDTNGSGADSRFNSPSGIATDGINLYVADTFNHVIRQIDMSGVSAVVVTTLAGKSGIAGFADGIGINATFKFPVGIVSDGTNLYVADTGNHTIRQIELVSRNVTTLAGSPLVSGAQNGTKAAARFSSPQGITTDGVSLYVTDTGNHTIRKIQ